MFCWIDASYRWNANPAENDLDQKRLILPPTTHRELPPIKQITPKHLKKSYLDKAIQGVFISC